MGRQQPHSLRQLRAMGCRQWTAQEDLVAVQGSTGMKFAAFMHLKLRTAILWLQSLVAQLADIRQNHALTAGPEAHLHSQDHLSGVGVGDIVGEVAATEGIAHLAVEGTGLRRGMEGPQGQGGQQPGAGVAEAEGPGLAGRPIAASLALYSRQPEMFCLKTSSTLR